MKKIASIALFAFAFVGSAHAGHKDLTDVEIVHKYVNSIVQKAPAQEQAAMLRVAFAQLDLLSKEKMPAYAQEIRNAIDQGHLDDSFLAK